MKAWQIQSTDGIDGLKQATLSLPRPGPGEVRVRLRANAINYRDLSVVSDPAARGIALPRIPNSDGAGEVLAVGEGGDRVRRRRPRRRLFLPELDGRTLHGGGHGLRAGRRGRRGAGRGGQLQGQRAGEDPRPDRKSTRLNSSP